MKKDIQPYFKLYLSFFENETYVTKMTDLQKVLHMLVLSEMNRKEAESEVTGSTKVMRFGHHWLCAALSTQRTHLSKALKHLGNSGYFSYTPGYKVEGRAAPSTIKEVATEEYYVPIDRYTLENLLYEMLKNKVIKYRHIVVYTLCKYIEQFKGGSVSVNDFGHMLGMTSEEIKYTRLKKTLEDLKSMNLINFNKQYGKIEQVEVFTLKRYQVKENKLREDIRLEGEESRYKEMGVKGSTTASTDDLSEPETIEDIYNNVKDIYTKRTGKKAVLSANDKRRMQSSQFSTAQIHKLTKEFLENADDRSLRQMDGHVFSRLCNFIQTNELEKYHLG